jgi:MraZ protein
MLATIPQFHGFKEHLMDPKFRVSIPVAWRPVEGQQLILQERTKYELPFLRVFTPEAFTEIIATIKNLPGISIGDIRDALDHLNESILSATINAQGKLLIPKEWSQRADIEAGKTVTLLGHGEHFDIINPDHHAVIKAKRGAKVLSSMADTGIFS